MISRKRMGEVVPFHKENILNTMKTAFSGRRQQIGNRSFEELLSVFLARLSGTLFFMNKADCPLIQRCHLPDYALTNGERVCAQPSQKTKTLTGRDCP